jgi:hypothetical protein
LSPIELLLESHSKDGLFPMGSQEESVGSFSA